MAKIISVFGPPNTGKTTVSVVIAQQLAEKGFNVCLVCADNVVPTIPTLLPQSITRVNEVKDKVHSVGKILSEIEYSTNDILKEVVFTKRFSKLVLIGYAYGENELSYAMPTEYDVSVFYNKLGTMVDYIVVDCGSAISNPLAKVGIESADRVIKVIGSSYKDITYFASNEELIPEGEVKKSEFITVYPMYKDMDAIEFLADFYGTIDYTIRHNNQISKMMQYGEYFMKGFPSEYTRIVKNLLEEVNFS